MLLLKTGPMEHALQECESLAEVDKALYGEHSLQYAKNLKVIGTILMIQERYSEAKEQYSQALKIFKLLGYNNLAKDMKSKIKTVEN